MSRRSARGRPLTSLSSENPSLPTHTQPLNMTSTTANTGFSSSTNSFAQEETGSDLNQNNAIITQDNTTTTRQLSLSPRKPAQLPRGNLRLGNLVANPTSKQSKTTLPSYLGGMDQFLPVQQNQNGPNDQPIENITNTNRVLNDDDLVQLETDHCGDIIHQTIDNVISNGQNTPQRPNPTILINTRTIINDCNTLASAIKHPTAILRLLYSHPFAFQSQTILPPLYPNLISQFSFFQNDKMFPSLLMSFPWLTNIFVILFYIEFELLHQKLTKLGSIIHKELENDAYQKQKFSTTHYRGDRGGNGTYSNGYSSSTSTANDPILTTPTTTPSTSSLPSSISSASSSTRSRLTTLTPSTQSSLSSRGRNENNNGGNNEQFDNFVTFPISNLVVRLLSIDIQQSIMDLYQSYDQISGDYQNIPKELLNRTTIPLATPSTNPTTTTTSTTGNKTPLSTPNSSRPSTPSSIHNKPSVENGQNGQNGQEATFLENYPNIPQQEFLSILCFLSNYSPDLFSTSTIDPALHNSGIVDPARLKVANAANSGAKFTLLNPHLSGTTIDSQQQTFGLRYLLFGWLGHDIVLEQFPLDLLELTNILSQNDEKNDLFDQEENNNGNDDNGDHPTAIKRPRFSTTRNTSSTPAKSIPKQQPQQPQHTQLFLTMLTTLTTIFFTRIKITIGRIAYTLLNSQLSYLTLQLAQKQPIPTMLQDQIKALKSQLILIPPNDPNSQTNKNKITAQLQQLILNLKKMNFFISTLSNSIHKTELQLPLLQRFVHSTLYAYEYCQYTIPLLEQGQKMMYTTPMTINNMQNNDQNDDYHLNNDTNTSSDNRDNNNNNKHNYHDQADLNPTDSIFGNLILNSSLLPTPTNSAPSTPSTRHNNCGTSQNVNDNGNNGGTVLSRYMDPSKNIFATAFSSTFTQLFTKLTPLALYPIPFTSYQHQYAELLDKNIKDPYKYPQGMTLGTIPSRLLNIFVQNSAILPSFALKLPSQSEIDQIRMVNEMVLKKEHDQVMGIDGNDETRSVAGSIPPTITASSDENIESNRSMVCKRMAPLNGSGSGSGDKDDRQKLNDITRNVKLVKTNGNNNGFNQASITESAHNTEMTDSKTIAASTATALQFVLHIEDQDSNDSINFSNLSPLSPNLTQFSHQFNTDAATKLISILLMIITPPFDITSPLHQLSISLKDDLLRSLLPPLAYTPTSLQESLPSLLRQNSQPGNHSAPTTPSPSSRNLVSTTNDNSNSGNVSSIDAKPTPPNVNLSLWIPQIVSKHLQTECYDKYTAYRLPTDSIISLEDDIQTPTTSLSKSNLSTQSQTTTPSTFSTTTTTATATTATTPSTSTLPSLSVKSQLSQSTTRQSNGLPLPPCNAVPLSDVNFITNHIKKPSDDLVPINPNLDKLNRTRQMNQQRLQHLAPMTPSSSRQSGISNQPPQTPTSSGRPLIQPHRSPRARLRGMSPIRSTTSSQSSNGSAFGTPSTSQQGSNMPQSTTQKLLMAVMTADQRQNMKKLKKDQELTLVVEINKFEAVQRALHWFQVFIAQANIASRDVSGNGDNAIQKNEQPIAIPSPVQSRFAYLFHHLRQLSWFFYKNDKGSNRNYRDHPASNNCLTDDEDEDDDWGDNDDQDPTSRMNDTTARYGPSSMDNNEEENQHPNLPKCEMDDENSSSQKSSQNSQNSQNIKSSKPLPVSTQSKLEKKPVYTSSTESSNASSNSLSSNLGLGNLSSTATSGGIRIIKQDIPQLPHCSPLLLFSHLIKALPQAYNTESSSPGHMDQIIGDTQSQHAQFIDLAGKYLATGTNNDSAMVFLAKDSTNAGQSNNKSRRKNEKFDLKTEISRQEQYCARFNGLYDAFQALKNEHNNQYQQSHLDDGSDADNDQQIQNNKSFPHIPIPHILPSLLSSTFSGSGSGIDISTVLKTIHADLDCLLSSTHIHGSMSRGNGVFSASISTLLNTTNVNSAFISIVSIDYATRFFPSNFTLYSNNELIWTKNGSIRGQVSETLTIVSFLYNLLDRGNRILIKNLSRPQLQLFRRANSTQLPLAQQQYQLVQNILNQSNDDLLDEREYGEYLLSYPRLSSNWWRLITQQHHQNTLKSSSMGFHSIISTTNSNQQTISYSPEQYLYKEGSYDHIYSGENDYGLNLGNFYLRYYNRLDRLVAAVVPKTIKNGKNTDGSGGSTQMSDQIDQNPPANSIPTGTPIHSKLSLLQPANLANNNSSSHVDQFQLDYDDNGYANDSKTSRTGNEPQSGQSSFQLSQHKPQQNGLTISSSLLAAPTLSQQGSQFSQFANNTSSSATAARGGALLQDFTHFKNPDPISTQVTTANGSLGNGTNIIGQARSRLTALNAGDSNLSSRQQSSNSSFQNHVKTNILIDSNDRSGTDSDSGDDWCL